MADLGGRLNITLRRPGGRLKAAIQSSRPTAASRVFIGKTIEETAAAIPILFRICGTAQASACASACEAASGVAPSPSIIRLRHLLVDAETVKEHLWRILLDWPGFVDEPSGEQAMSNAMAAYLEVRALLNRGKDALRPGAYGAEPDIPAAMLALDHLALISAEHVLGVQPVDWLAGVESTEHLLAWADSTDTAAARLFRRVREQGWSSIASNRVTALPTLSAADLDPLLSGVDADRFLIEPLWNGKPRESSPFTRRMESSLVEDLTRGAGNGLLPRLAAQLVDLASLQQDLRRDLLSLDEPIAPLGERTRKGLGFAQVQAARGLLVHRVGLRGNRICDYRILAPTEWNFHPRGVVAQGLSSLEGVDDEILQRQASLFVTAVDPCVAYHLTIA